MKQVSRFEASLLRILDGLLGRAPLEQTLPLILADRPEPKCLSRDAIRLVEDRLAKGCVRRLARLGWQRERFLCNQTVVAGRLWERTPPAELALRFTGHALRFLMWLTAGKPGKSGWSPPPAELASGDLLLLYFSYEALRGSEVAAALRPRPAFDHHGLVRLAFPDDFELRQASLTPNFGPWLTGVGAAILEALQPVLRERWHHLEVGKPGITDAAALRQLGNMQEAVLDRFLDAVESVNRLDLARFLLEVSASLLTADAGPPRWIRADLHAGNTLAERRQTYQAALALVRQLPRWRNYAHQARAIGYFDEGYAAAQLFKEDWEAWQGDALVSRAQAILRQVEPLR